MSSYSPASRSRVVLVPGRDASGASAWPRQHGLALDFDALFLRQDPEKPLDAETLIETLGGVPAAVVAHGEGSTAAVNAAVERPLLVSALVLCEPWLPELTARNPGEQGDGIIPGVPMLVVSGGWEPAYERIARLLAESGAEHVVVPGGHRPQDSPEGADAIKAFLRRHL
ncbi:alpha/beta fold hydrolase [Arthrobacter sp. NPDC090010]|uniref:alpha/beta fold hydrolase n=1 Tax=Arthrobacter sp. NPDC090010 TaxID=3363942 RepID=UPI0038130A18